MKNIFEVRRDGRTNSISEAENIVRAYLARNPGLQLTITEDVAPTATAQYNRLRDVVRIRPESDPEFEGDPENWYRALFHELTHSTGHKFRNDRDMGGRTIWGGENFAYGVEELTAELGSSFLTEECGMWSQRQMHTKYLRHYIGEIAAAPSTLARAARQAAEGVQLILGRDCKAAQDAMRLVA